MGGSFSEPATLIDLGHDTRKLYTQTSVQERIGWSLAGYKIEELVAGLCHVGDALLASRVFCHRCLLKGLRKLWPSDVGTNLEEFGSTVKFLQVRVDALPNGAFTVMPAAQNLQFVQGLCNEPEVAKCVPFVDKGSQDYFQIKSWLWGRLITFEKLAGGRMENAMVATSALLAEALLLGWPVAWVGRCLRTLPRSDSSNFTKVLRKLGHMIKSQMPSQPYVFLHDKLSHISSQLN